MDNIVNIIEKSGPLTGKELYEKTGIDELRLWRACYKSSELTVKTFGRKYLRLDKKIEGYARLSPSIMREFLTYSVIGLKKDIAEIEHKAQILNERTKLISRKKYELALNVVSKIVDSFEDSETLKNNVCFMIAGDVVYDMAHAEPRPESSSGKLVRGSDLDIIVISRNLPEGNLEGLDLAIYKEKSFLLRNPGYMEEIDYVVKDISKAYEQMEFNDFKSMIASKILHEGVFLYGSREIFDAVKEKLVQKNIPEKLSKLENEAALHCKEAFEYLLKNENELLEEEFTKYFYTKEESEEIF